MQLPEITFTDTSRSQNLLWQAGGAIAWGAFFVLAPWEIVYLGAIVWIPWLIRCERLRSSRYGLMPGLLIRAAIVTSMLIGAINAPVKFLDERVGPFASSTISLDELAKEDVIRLSDEIVEKSLQIVLPSKSPTRREIMHSIDQQTDWRAHYDTCASGSTLLFGDGGGQISLIKR